MVCFLSVFFVAFFEVRFNIRVMQMAYWRYICSKHACISAARRRQNNFYLPFFDMNIISLHFVVYRSPILQIKYQTKTKELEKSTPILQIAWFVQCQNHLNSNSLLTSNSCMCVACYWIFCIFLFANIFHLATKQKKKSVNVALETWPNHI